MNPGSLRNPAAHGTTGHRQGRAWAPEKLILPFVSLLAAIQIVWFYINRLPSYIDLDRYEAGVERMPFQGRLLMEYPLRWAHTSHALSVVASGFNALRLFIPRKSIPEDVMEGAIYLLSILVAGFVARDLYRKHSRTGLLTPFVFPLALVMIAGSYCFGAINFFRYFYDLPSLGLFSAGLFLIARRYHPALFAALFVVATINRESSVFLLFLYLLSSCVVSERMVWKRALRLNSGGVTALLAIFWLGWRMWTKQHFSGLTVIPGPGIAANMVALIVPVTWPQLVGIAGYTIPAILAFRRELHSTELRAWLRVFPLCFFLMMWFGVIFEIRLFGEFIPVFACVAMLLAEERILLKAGKLETTSSSLDGYEAGPLEEATASEAAGVATLR